MRRMLDKKELEELGGGGGGGGGSASHAYRIIENSSFWYISYTSKDYGQFEIGKMMDAPTDILSNDEYKELLSIGTHNAGGIIKDSGYDHIVIWFRIDRKEEAGYYGCTFSGYRLQDNTQSFMEHKLRSASSIKVVKLF